MTTVLIPAITNPQSPANQLHLFEVLEGKFSIQAKVTTLLTGLSGFYMLHAMNAWSSMHWWVHLMIFVLAIYTVVLFVLEPLFLHKWFHQKAKGNTESVFFVLQITRVFCYQLVWHQ